MKKVLTIAMVFALFTVSASGQNEKTENLRRQRIEQRFQNREGQFRNRALLRRQGMMSGQQMMRQRTMRQKALADTRGKRMRMVQPEQRRKLMLRRHYLHRRVI